MCASAAVQALAQGFKDDPDTLPILKDRAQSDDDGDVRRAAVQALAQGFKDDPDTLPILKTRAQSDENEFVRRAAVQALAQGFKDDPDTLPILKALTKEDKSEDVRKTAFSELDDGWLKTPGILVFLVACFLDDQALQPEEMEGCNRLEVFQKLFEEYGGTEAEKFEVLQDRAQNDSDQQLRTWAAEQLEQFKIRN
jgi:hypothetical protein